MTQSARAPGDDQNAGSLKFENVPFIGTWSWRRIGLRRRASGGHPQYCSPTQRDAGPSTRERLGRTNHRGSRIVGQCEPGCGSSRGMQCAIPLARLFPRSTFANAKLHAVVSMPQSSSAGKTVRFDVFSVDLAAGELRKKGARIRLQEQPFQLLAFLLERPGELVSRDELRQKLWPANTFVDFDHSLNTAVNKLREALGDSASNPRFVETLARRGYRFLAAVEADGAQPVLTETSKAGSLIATATPVAEFESGLDIPLPNPALIRGLFGLTQIMYLTFYIAALFHLTEVERIISSFLQGSTGSALFVAVLITAGVGIPLRFYLLSAVAFDHRQIGKKFQRMFLIILLMDQLWAISPFLLANKIGFGAAFAAVAALIYVPFSERTLMRMAYPTGRNVSPSVRLV